MELPNGNLIVFGQKGCGKTTLVKGLIPQVSRVVVVDPIEEVPGSGRGEYSDVAVQLDNLDQFPDYFAQAGGQWRVSLHNDHLEDDFPALCDLVYQVGKCWLIVEEVDWFCDPHFIPDSLARVIKYGRHRGVEVCAISRTPSEVHRVVTRQAYLVASFLVVEPNDLDYLRRYVGSGFAEGLNALPPYTYRLANLRDRTQPIREEQVLRQ